MSKGEVKKGIQAVHPLQYITLQKVETMSYSLHSVTLLEKEEVDL
jgi:hypothetical protein